MEEVQGCHCIRGGQEQLSALNRRSRRRAPDASEELRAEALISLVCYGEEQSQQVRGETVSFWVWTVLCVAPTVCWTQRWNENSGVTPGLSLSTWRGGNSY